MLVRSPSSGPSPACATRRRGYDRPRATCGCGTPTFMTASSPELPRRPSRNAPTARRPPRLSARTTTATAAVRSVQPDARGADWAGPVVNCSAPSRLTLVAQTTSSQTSRARRADADPESAFLKAATKRTLIFNGSADGCPDEFGDTGAVCSKGFTQQGLYNLAHSDLVRSRRRRRSTRRAWRRSGRTSTRPAVGSQLRGRPHRARAGPDDLHLGQRLGRARTTRSARSPLPADRGGVRHDQRVSDLAA